MVWVSNCSGIDPDFEFCGGFGCLGLDIIERRRMRQEKRRGGDAFSSSITQGAHPGCPIDMAPKIGTETLNPLFPSFTYSALLFSTESKRDLGGVGVAMMLFV